jgi:hypothetical protein
MSRCLKRQPTPRRQLIQCRCLVAFELMVLRSDGGSISDEAHLALTLSQPFLSFHVPLFGITVAGILRVQRMGRMDSLSMADLSSAPTSPTSDLVTEPSRNHALAGNFPLI